MTDPMEHLAGRWVGRGAGDYPTIEPFSYSETLEVVQVPGRPVATWRSTTADGATGEPRHAEVGFVRPAGDGLELVVAHGFGVTEISVASAPTDGAYRFESVSVACSPTAEHIEAVLREIRVRGDALDYETSMAAVGVEMALHLTAHLRRV
jgi:hypothetical protein